MALRWGILSAGRISHDFMVGLNALPETEHRAVAVAARSLESSSQFSQTHDIPTAYSSYEELSQDPQVDVVYVGIVPACHKDAVLMMFQAGKPVLCEKPLTTSPEDTATLIKAAKEKGVFFMEAVWMRFFPAIIELRRQITSGVIGEVKYIQASLGFRTPKLPDHMTDPKMKGSSVLEVGVYPINFVTMIFGRKPETVHASGWLTDTGVDEFAAVTLRYSGQRVAQVSCSFNLNLPEFPLPARSRPTVFVNSEGLCYEAAEVRKCIMEGKLESEAMPVAHTQIVAEIMHSSNNLYMIELSCISTI